MIHPYIETETVSPVGDTRAQLWARMYTTVLGSIAHAALLSGQDMKEPNARRIAIGLAGCAVADFDEHYLGGKR